jgi:class 3 adenylate cyclase/predicted ATPase
MDVAQQEMEGENRLVTALFADISGFTPMSQELSPEASVEKVNQCFQVITDAVYRYEGSINRFIGDCVLAFFGAPLTHENDPERAIMAALDMREAVSQIGLNVSIGINTGMTYFGPIGTQQHLEVSAYGHDVNLAKRLQDSAEPGQIFVGTGTYRLTRRAFDFNYLDAVTLKGITSPVPVYEVLGVKERPEKLRGIEGMRARMIGREHEFAELKEATDAWLGGQGQIVSIIGEAGIGKSRLVAELRDYLEQENSLSPFYPRSLSLLEGRCVSIGQPTSYWPFLDILRAYFDLSEEDDISTRARKVTESVTHLFPQTAEEMLPFLGYLLSIQFGNELDEKPRYFTPEQIRHQTLMRLRDLFETLAEKQPLLLILEDLHWADDLSLDLISLLMDELANWPLMLLCVYRPEREHRVWQLSNLAQRKCLDRYTEITLKQLSSRESRELVETLLKIENLPESIKEMILRRSEGNPFFIEEVIRSLIDRDMVYRDGEHWKARREISLIDVPDTIQSVLLARVDRLQAEARYVLQCASVIGRLFRYRLLEHMTRQERDLNRYLDEFEERELIYEERTVPELEYAFRHALTQEATYQSILERRRKEFHHQVAQGIEQFYQERLEEYYEELAHHYSRSDDIQKALEYLLKAGNKALRLCACREAIAHFSKGLELVKTLPDTPERAQQELDLQFALGISVQVIEGYGSPEAGRAYARAVELCQQIGETPQLLQALEMPSAVHLMRAEHQKARELIERKLSLAQRLGDPMQVDICHWQLGLVSVQLGELIPARERFERGIAWYDPQQHLSLTFRYGVSPGVSCLAWLSWALWLLGYPDRALERSQEALALAQELDHAHTLVFALTVGAYPHAFRGEIQASKEQAEASVRISTEQGFAFFQAVGTFSLGWLQVQEGQVEEGIAQMRQSIADQRTTGAKVQIPHYLALLAEAYGEAGQTEDGLSVLAEALEAAQSTGERYYEPEIHRLKGELLLMQGEAEAEVEASYRQAIQVAQQQQAKSLELRAATSLSRLLQKQGRKEEARQMLEEVYDWFTEGFDTADLKEARALLEELGA